MLTRPVIKPHFSVHLQEPDTVVLLSETQELALKGEFYYLLTPFLDGRPVPEIHQAMASQATVEEVDRALEILNEAGFLQEHSSLPAPQVAFWSSLGHQAERVEQVFASSQVILHALGIDCEPTRAALASLGLSSLEQAAGTNLLSGAGLASANAQTRNSVAVVLVDDYLNAELAEWNRQALQHGVPWLLVKPGGRQPYLGPLFVPGRTSCWQCMAQRMHFNRQLELMFRPQQSSLNQGYLPLSLTWMAQQTALAIGRWLLDGSLPLLENRLRTLDLFTGESEVHQVVRRPQCPACGEASLQIPTPILLEDVALSVCDGGSYRAASAQETWDRFCHHISPLTGVVTEVREVSVGGDAPIYVFNSGNNLSRPAGKIDAKSASNFRMQSSGKGRNPLEARVGALCEAIERYSFSHLGGEPVRRARLVDLGEEGIHPNLCALYSQAQFDQRKEWNATHKGMHRVPVPFDPEALHDWTPVWSLTRQQVRYLPSSYCFYYYRPEQSPEPGKKSNLWYSDSNGNAAGGNLAEAILQGLFELVERDGVALWWYNRLSCPAVEWQTFDNPYLFQLDRYYQSLGRDLWYLDLTTDLEWPVFACVSALKEGGGEAYFGFGCHSNPQVALTRAATEINQFLCMAKEMVKQELPEDATPMTHAELLWLRQVNLQNNAWLAPDPTRSPRPLSYYKADTGSTGRERVLRAQNLLESRGLELLALNCTRLDVGLPSVKVMVPGLRFFWPRYAPGRLYDTPVQLGYLERPLREDELNPIALFW